ncbi:MULTISPECIES: acetylglutamate kinase [Clostridium]|uniref:Acetylglutamate kinase n=2 Tax=Clostridium TaxID=1485 RepID=A0A151AL22_9CLOT|nr:MULTISPECIES: acetylglutamate kinase [Clostridium]KYH28356.1 acetylglutamate kinase [Clostridium colicanis DSM 13634]MBE6043587.1 acetylglutamate kinase [Clostridium thermopalmarium]PRR68798.1 Acetylglutamate kinase [Clostridium thermopalmarium DSM 5974]PVZ22619.1 N-acetylglutamate kinase [Clostridium thermopalmarium DSM 5974]
MESKANYLNVETFLEINKFKGKIFVIKYGGSIMDNKEAQHTFIDDLLLLTSIGIKIVIVHGGGPEISKWIKKTGGENRFVKGLRVTDKSTMEIVEMVLSGNINKKLSSNLSRKGLTAIGLSGKDSGLIKAKKKYVYDGKDKVDIGFVGEITGINKELLLNLLDNNVIPVISPIGCDDDGNSYNINADYAASFISGTLKAEKFLIMTDVDGIYMDTKDPSSILPCIDIDEIKEYINSDIVTGGMIPKLECCINALNKGTKSVHLINGNKEHNLLFNITNHIGTQIVTKRSDNLCQKIV